MNVIRMLISYSSTYRKRRNVCRHLTDTCSGSVIAQVHCILFIYSSMALQPFVGPWPLLQFRNLFYTDSRTPWSSDQSVARPLPTHRTTQTTE
jgi:hypothetical protein